MSKRYEVENFGEELKDIERALREVHEKMIDISKNRGIVSGSPEYISMGEQLSVRVYKQHFYTPDEEQYKEHKNKLQEVEKEVWDLMRSFVDPMNSAFAEYEGLTNAMNAFKLELSEVDSQEDFKKNKYKNKSDVKDMIKRCLSHITAVKGSEKAIDALVNKTYEYFSHFDYVYNQSGYMAGIYRNNGEHKIEKYVAVDPNTGRTIEKEYIVDKNLLTMGFIRAKHFDYIDKVKNAAVDTVISSTVGLIFDEGFIKDLRGTGIAGASKLSDLLVKLNDKTKNIKGLIEFGNNSKDFVDIGKFFAKEEIARDFKNGLTEVELLCKELSVKDGLTEEGRKRLKTLSMVTALLKLPYGVGLAAAIILGPQAEIFGSQRAEEIGRVEISRFIANIKAGKTIDDAKVNATPNTVEYNNETELESIVANGKHSNVIKAGSKNNYIRAIDGIHNILDGGAGDDQIIGWDYTDKIIGGDGNDVIRGGKGNDTLYGGLGDNVYLYEKGDGNDLIGNWEDGNKIHIADSEYRDHYESALIIKGYSKENIVDILKDEQGRIKIVFSGEQDTVTINDPKAYIVDSFFDKMKNKSVDYLIFLDENNKPKEEIRLTDLLLMSKENFSTNEMDNYVFLEGNQKQKVKITGGNNRIQGGKGSDEYIFTDQTKGHTKIRDVEQLKDGFNTIVFKDLNILEFESAGAGKGNYRMNQAVQFVKKDGNLIIKNGSWSVEITEDSIKNMNLRFADGTIRAYNYMSEIEKAIEWKMKYGVHNLSFDLSRFGSVSVEHEEVGTSESDNISGEINRNNEIFGFGGNDYIRGGGYDNVIHGGSGNDTIYGGSGVNFIYGDDGDDTIYAQHVTPHFWMSEPFYGGNVLDGGSGNDTLYGGKQEDLLSGGSGDDKLSGHDGDDQIEGGSGEDVLWGGNGDDVLRGDSGEDILDGFRVIIMTVANSLRKSRVPDALPMFGTREYMSLSIL